MGLFIRTIGLARARTKIGLANLVYNMKRVLFLQKQALVLRPAVGLAARARRRLR